MVRIWYVQLLLLCMVSANAQQNAKAKNSKIGFISAGLPAYELSAVRSFLKDQKDAEVSVLNYTELLNGKYKPLNLTHLWIHRLSASVAAKEEIAAGKELRKFVENGGHLILSMEAVRLLNNWGIEKKSFEVKTDSVIDEGFGRLLGFHAFKSHPVFEGLNGGVYSWKGKKDHVIRKIGFFNNDLPDTTLAKVIGVEWGYITFHEQNKLLLEYKLGKGSIIAVGAYSYFAADNFNTMQLHRFYRNLLRYTDDSSSTIKSHYWDYHKQEVQLSTKKLSKINRIASSSWKLPELSISIDNKEAGIDFVSLAGRRILLMGKQKGGIDEIWTHPFMSFRDVDAGVVFKGTDSVVWLKNLIPSITISPELLIREYRINKTVIKEVTTVSMDKPVAVVHYEWEGSEPAKILLKYTTNFRYMWPYSDKVSASIKYQWSPEMNAVTGSAQHGDLASIVGFSSIPDDYRVGQFKEMGFKNGLLTVEPTDLVQLSGIFTFNTSGNKGALSAYLLGTNEGIDTALKVYQQTATAFEGIVQETSVYFKKLLKDKMMVITPDEQFNAGYKWAIARTDQFFQETPGLGTSLMAGFGTTARGWNGAQKISGRPGYAWYFGRDAQWSGMAVNGYGDWTKIKKTLQVFADFQDLNGKIYHELTSSGAVHYDASDATPLYVVLAANYLKYSGDLDFAKELWPSLKRAMDFCYSTDTDKDGLIEITNVGHGWIEGGPLFGAHTEIYLAGTWVAALDAAAYIAKSLNKANENKRYLQDAAEVRKIIDAEFWNKKEDYFYNGKMKDGSFMKAQTVLTGVPVYFNAISDSVKAIKATAAFSGNDYSADWGLRMLPESSPLFNPGAYHAGMIWPLFTGFAALAEYKTGRYVSGFTHIMNNLLLYRNWALGSAEETLNGSVYKAAGICSQQAWSETMILQPVIEGMLGVSCDALSNNISLSPRFPEQWDEVKVENITFGAHGFHMYMKRNTESTVYTFKYLKTKQDDVGKGGCDLVFNPSFLSGTTIQKVLVNGKEAVFNVDQELEGISLKLSKFHLDEDCKIEILHTGGIGVLPMINEPKPGDQNQGLKITGQSLNGKQYTVDVEGLKGKIYEIKVQSRFKIKTLQNGQIIDKKGDLYHIRLSIPDTSTAKYVKQAIVLDLKR